MSHNTLYYVRSDLGRPFSRCHIGNTVVFRHQSVLYGGRICDMVLLADRLAYRVFILGTEDLSTTEPRYSRGALIVTDLSSVAVASYRKLRNTDALLIYEKSNFPGLEEAPVDTLKQALVQFNACQLCRDLVKQIKPFSHLLDGDIFYVIDHRDIRLVTDTKGRVFHHQVLLDGIGRYTDDRLTLFTDHVPEMIPLCQLVEARIFTLSEIQHVLDAAVKH